MSLPSCTDNFNQDTLPKAPKIPNTRQKVIWSEDGINDYENLISPVLSSLRGSWLDPSSSSSTSILLQSTYEIMSTAAKHTNKVVNLGRPQTLRKVSIPISVIEAARKQELAYKHWLHISDDPNSSQKEKNRCKRII